MGRARSQPRWRALTSPRLTRSSTSSVPSSRRRLGPLRTRQGGMPGVSPRRWDEGTVAQLLLCVRGPFPCNQSINYTLFPCKILLIYPGPSPPATAANRRARRSATVNRKPANQQAAPHHSAALAAHRGWLAAMDSSTAKTAEAVLGMYLVRLRFRCRCSRAASWRAILDCAATVHWVGQEGGGLGSDGREQFWVECCAACAWLKWRWMTRMPPACQ